MRIVFTILSIFTFAARRLWHNLGLVLGTAIGLIAAVALVISIPLYADGVNYRLMSRALAQQNADSNRPPFAFMFRYIGSWYGAVDYASFQKADAFMANEAPGIIGLPVDQSIRYVKTDNLLLFASGSTNYSDPKQALDRVAIGFVSGFADHIRIIEGRYPAAQAANSSDPLDVVVSEDEANQLGLVVGEVFTLQGEMANNVRAYNPIQVRVLGIWRARDASEQYWFYRPEAFDTVFMTTEESFTARVVPMGKQPVYLALWYMLMDGRAVHTEDVNGLRSRITVVSTMADRTLPKTSLDISPADALSSYVDQTQLLTILLFVFAIPILGLVLYFIVLTTNLVVQRQRNEIAVLRSRGMSALQIVAVYLLEGVMMGAAAMIVGPLLGQFTATSMGAARSFLSFSSSSPLLITLSRQSIRVGFAAVGVALLSTMLPAIGAARHTIVTYKQDIARSLQKPWWQRLYVDFLLLAIPLYGYYLLKQRGTISFLGQSATAAEGDPFKNPLLFIVPTLFVFALALIFIRLFPIVLGILARLFEYLPWAPALLALRQLARAWGYYTGPLLLIILTMGLACFTASMARTLDSGLYDQTYYDVGADVRLVETGDTSTPDSSGSGTAASATQTTGFGDNQGPVYYTFLPVSEHLKVKGVQAATRTASFAIDVSLGQNHTTGNLVGIDRLSYVNAAYWRRDFAPQSLGALINDLAVEDRAALVTPDFLGKFGLRVGDNFAATVRRYTTSYDMSFVVAGIITMWPGAYPDQGPTFICNLDYLWDQMGGEYPYDVLLRTAPGSDSKRIVSDLSDLDLKILDSQDTRALMSAERERPERQGILGLLSVGAIAASLLTVLGLLFYALVSFRRRFIELGILRAIGLSTPQMVLALGLEQFALIVSGVAAGTGFGVLTSRLFIPFLQVREGARAQIPPFVVQLAWGDILKVYAIFGALLLVTVVGLVWLLMRMRIAEAVKLGESIET